MGNYIPMHERFWRKVLVSSKDECWEWTGATNNRGYGQLSRPYHGPLMLAHRFSASLHFGMFNQKLLVLHTCDNRKCVNPNHLFLGSQKDNMIDCFLKGRIRGAALPRK